MPQVRIAVDDRGRRGPYRVTVTDTSTGKTGAAPETGGMGRTGGAGGPGSPELRMARGALDGLRQDLFHDAFAYRRLGPLPMTGRAARLVPRRLRAAAVWTPHALIVLLAFVVLGVGASQGGGVAALVPVVPVLLTLVRPLAAWWVSSAVVLLFSVVGPGIGAWPWTPATAASHLCVMTIVGARTRPRTGAWMWLLTGAFSLFIAGFVRGTRDFAFTGLMLFLSAFVLLMVSLLHVRRTAQEEVAAHRTETAVERDRRTLLEERTTIARELHDVVAHHMSVVAIQAEAAPYRVEDPPPELAQAFATIRENAVAALTELRRVLGVVRAADYEAPDAPQPTLADLDNLLANVREAGLDAEKAVTGAVRPLPQGVELSAYRIVQEALSNALRHAPGAAARVEISHVLGGLGLRVVNSPPLGPAKPSPGSGHGLTGMRERVAMLSGEMTAGPTEEGGYEVAAFLPVPVAVEQEPGA
jgi:signal transduction histidine kinase